MVVSLKFSMCKIECESSVVPSINATFTPSIIRHTGQIWSNEGDHAAMLQELKDTKVFRVCADFLDGKSTAEVIMRLG